MRSVAKALSCFTAVLLVVAAGLGLGAQDPRIGLKPGFRDAGTAIHNLELVWSLPKPDGFFDPKAPAGTPNPPEPPNASNTSGAATAAPSPAAQPSNNAPSPVPETPAPGTPE